MKMTVEFISKDPVLNNKLISALVQVFEQENGILKNISFQEEAENKELIIPAFISRRNEKHIQNRRR